MNYTYVYDPHTKLCLIKGEDGIQRFTMEGTQHTVDAKSCQVVF